MQQGDRKPVSGREMQVIEYLAALDAQLISHQDVLRERLRTLPHGWRQWRLMTTTVSSLLIALYDTMPTKNLMHMEQLCKYGEVLVRIKPASSIPGRMNVSEADLREIVGVAMSSECAMCVRNASEVRACRLRKAMETVVLPDIDSAYGCPYREALIRGEEGREDDERS